jgi:hypothetical protein
MSKAKPVIDRTEASAAIDRSIELLKTLKIQLRAKSLDGQTLDDLLDASRRNLEPVTDQFRQLRADQLDALLLKYRGGLDQL